MICLEVKNKEGIIQWRVHLASKELADAFVKDSVENNHWGAPGDYEVQPYIDLSLKPAYHKRVWAGFKKAWAWS